MRTLFIHPIDQSTDFCSAVYEGYIGRDDMSLLRGNNMPKRTIKDMISSHDRIVFLGHGTEYGLLDMRYQFRYVVSSGDVYLLRDKELVCMWCDANIFTEKYGLNAFATGMFVSEPKEALFYNLPTDQESIDQSNALMCRTLHDHIFESIESIRNAVSEGYKAENNRIVQFNRECMDL